MEKLATSLQVTTKKNNRYPRAVSIMTKEGNTCSLWQNDRADRGGKNAGGKRKQIMAKEILESAEKKNANRTSHLGNEKAGGSSGMKYGLGGGTSTTQIAKIGTFAKA